MKKINVKQFRRELSQRIIEARKEIADRQAGIDRAEQVLKMLDSFEVNSNGKKAIKAINGTKPEGAIGVTEAILRVLASDNGLRIGGVIAKVVALKPYSHSADLPRTITATVAGLHKRGAIRRHKTKEGWAYFSKPATATAKAAA